MMQSRTDAETGGRCLELTAVATEAAKEAPHAADAERDAAADKARNDNVTRATALMLAGVAALIIEAPVVIGVALGAAAMAAPQIVAMVRARGKKAAESGEPPRER